MKNYLLLFVVIVLTTSSAFAQQGTSHDVITLDNLDKLRSVRTLDYDDLPSDIEPDAGQFVMNADASVIVSFGQGEDDGPFGRAIRWGPGGRIINKIDDSSIARYLTNDGECLYVGYLGYIMVYAFNPDAAVADVFAGPIELPSPGDSAVNFWLDEDEGCSKSFFVEVVHEDGMLAVFQIIDGLPKLLHKDLFMNIEGEVAARVGRIPPPFALTIDFEGTLYRWDMTAGTVTGEMSVGEIAMFGKLNNSGDVYAWLSTGTGELRKADFGTDTISTVAILDYVYIPHLVLSDAADVVIAVDPSDNRGTVSAWAVNSGERYNLGEYRECERIQPDLVRLSLDGTSLVIGCDTGIDVWQLVQPEAS